MKLKKRINGSWTDIPHYIYDTATDTITTLPVDIYANDTTATVGLKGQTVQSSIPSPNSPVTPEGTGERTGNLFDSSSITLVPVSTSATRSGTNLGILPQGNYVLSATATVGATQLYRTIKDDNNYTFETIRELPYTFTADGTSEQIIRTSGSNFTSWFSTGYTDIMLNLGSTALPYEPYGYKIPISSANTTTPVYLGEVQTTRNIKKLVLTGVETITKAANNPVFTMQLGGSNTPLSENVITTLSTHYQAQSNTTGTGNVADMRVCIRRGYGTMYIGDTRYDNTTDFKEWLAQQYTAGTPVTIWYVLATPTTGIVNEPLMKIGDYADEVANISVPVTAGVDTLSVDTTVQPSEVTLNYHGWHPIDNIHEHDDGEWN